MASPGIKCSTFHITRRALAYSIRHYRMGLVTHEDLPPPLDHFPEFPEVYFKTGGEPLLVGDCNVINSTVFQIVLDNTNLYIMRFGQWGYRNWDAPDVAFGLVNAWLGAGKDVVIHTRRRGVRAAGESRGMACFVVGCGVSLFAAWEVGLMPNTATLMGKSLGGMVAVYGVEFGGGVQRPATYHLLPAKYLVNPFLPGLPPGLTQGELLYRLAPPLLFCKGSVVGGTLDLYHSIVVVDVSSLELDEDALSFHRVTMRGSSYRVLRSLPV
ncbi:hypothetical protein BJ322DRAFT_1018046 [Thelephora terrestris]|uniref:Uncharacterized protein n=1 Tax=Thelephora terrestris TaxID=56493 RepID=A0A9P6LAE2_9AGAM|nr:hypothetical protein BJ322DRAFT_1018046 [Thelephora terrestris]